MDNYVQWIVVDMDNHVRWIFYMGNYVDMDPTYNSTNL